MENKPSILRIDGLFSTDIKETCIAQDCVVLAPPLLVSFSSLDDYLDALPAELRDEFAVEISELVNKGLPPVVSARCLAALFGYSPKFINALSERNFRYYREFVIRKGSKKRKIQAPRVAIKVIQKWFATHLSATVTFDDSVYGFVPGRSAVDAAGTHCGADWVYSVDIKDYFPSTSIDSVATALREIGYSERGASLISSICGYASVLAQGAPSSPLMSNLALAPVHQQLKALSEHIGCRFTRYADDVVFSGAGDFPGELKDRVSEIFEATEWKLSPQKEYLAEIGKGQRLKVHGLLVHGEAPRLTKGYRNKIRAYRHLLDAGKVNPADEKRIRGHIKYAESVEKWTKPLNSD